MALPDRSGGDTGHVADHDEIHDLLNGTPWFNVRGATYGATGDGVTDDTAAIQAAIDAAEAAGGGKVIGPAGAFRTTGTITVPETVTFKLHPKARINYEGTGSALVIEGDHHAGRHVVGRIFQAHANTWEDGSDTSSVGLTIKNCHNAEVYIPRVEGFHSGLLMQGDGANCHDNDIHIGELFNNKRNLVGESINGGTAKENSFHGGRYRIHSDNAGTAGTRAILQTASADDQWTFYHPELSSGHPELTAELNGNGNNFFGGRYESVGNNAIQVNGDRNHFFGGQNNRGWQSDQATEGSGGQIFDDQGNDNRFWGWASFEAGGITVAAYTGRQSVSDPRDVALGNAAVVDAGQGGVAIGSGATAGLGGGAGNPVCVGRGTQTSDHSGVAIGMTADARDDHNVAIGWNASARGNNTVAVGRGASASATNAVALGRDTVADDASSVALGQGSITSVGSQVMIGSRFLGMLNTTATSFQQGADEGRIGFRDNGGTQECYAVFANGTTKVLANDT